MEKEKKVNNQKVNNQKVNNQKVNNQKVNNQKVNNQELNNQQEKKKINKWLKVTLIPLLIVILSIIIVAGVFVGNKLGKINFKKLDEKDLEINEDLYSEIEGLTQKEYDQVINIVLLGSDSKDMNNTYGGSSDAIMIISVNPKYKSIKLISIPRDTAAYIEGENNRYKINYAFAKGREQLAIKTINKTFDLNLKEYLTINISSMYDIINELGGVEVNITKDEMKWINEYAEMFYKFSGKPTKKVTNYGKVTLTGEQAAAHVKERMAGSANATQSHGDYGRTVRQREVIISMLNKIASKDIGEISRIIDLVLEQVTTNIDVAKYTTMLPEFISNKDAYLNNITSVMLPSLDYSKEIYENGAYLYVTDNEKAKKDFIKYMYQM